MENLKPCPFCGSYDSIGIHAHTNQEENIVTIFCANCIYIISFKYWVENFPLEKAIEQTIKKWNKRS